MGLMERRVTVLDGGMGRELWRIGAPFRQPEWSALALTEGPEWVVQAHVNFIDAGARVITTNSYAIVPFHIGEERFAAEARDLAAVSGRLAREAVAVAGTDGETVRVAGSLPPLFGSYLPERFDSKGARRIIDPLVAGLAPFVDVWLGETLGGVAEAAAVREALDRAGDARPLWISYTLDDDRPGCLRSGEPVREAVAAALALGSTAVLFNCSQAETISTAIGTAVEVIDEVGRADVEVGGYANRFVASHTSTGEANSDLSLFRDDLDPDAYGEFVEQWLDRGATIIGGCCGIGPGHVAHLAQLAAR